MAGIKTLADGRDQLYILTTPPADINAITIAELTAGINASCKVAKNGTRFSATDSDTESDPELCSEGNEQVMTLSNYEGAIVPFWYLDDDGHYIAADNPVFEAVRVKGTELTYVWVTGLPRDTTPAADDYYDAFVGVSDNPRRQDGTGWIKRPVTVRVRRGALHKQFVAA